MTSHGELVHLSETVIKGLQFLNEQQDNETVQKIIERSIRRSIAREGSGIMQDIIPGSVAQMEYALVSLVVISAKEDITSNELKCFLDHHKIRESLSDQICREYEMTLAELRVVLSSYGHTQPYIADANWKMSCNVQSDSVNSHGELLYKISLEDVDSNSGATRSVADFTCNTEELQSLIVKLKDVERHCEKVGSGK